VDAVPLCEPWPVSGCADLSAYPAPITGVGFMAASELLWAASGRQYGSCMVTVRPCSRRCLEQPYGGWWWRPDAWSGGWPYGPTHGGWMHAVCGTCGDACACSAADTLRLPQPAQSIVSVTIDGVPLPPSGYVLYDGRNLVRVDGDWPFCQDWTATSGPGTFEVAAIFGQPVPAIASLAMGELLPEVLKACRGDPCQLPAGTVSQVTRQGVTKTFVDATRLAEVRLSGLYALPLVGRFLEFANPGGVILPAKIWNPDDVIDRIEGGVT
jgi:hypothetical protein